MIKFFLNRIVKDALRQLKILVQGAVKADQTSILFQDLRTDIKIFIDQYIRPQKTICLSKINLLRGDR